MPGQCIDERLPPVDTRAIVWSAAAIFMNSSRLFYDFFRSRTVLSRVEALQMALYPPFIDEDTRLHGSVRKQAYIAKLHRFLMASL